MSEIEIYRAALAQARIWINFADTRLFTTSGKLLYGRDSNPTALLAELSEHLQFMEHEGLGKNLASSNDACSSVI
jgi:glutathione S-transferase